MGSRRSIKYSVCSLLLLGYYGKRLSLFSDRPYWRCYFPNTSAIIYVIDSADTARLQTSRSELLTMLSEEELNGVPLLVFCNKQDMEGALKPEEISEQLGLAGGEKGRDWSVRGSCATKGEGLEEGLDWYVNSCYVWFLPSINFYTSSGWWMQYKRSSRIESQWPFASPIFTFDPSIFVAFLANLSDMP